MLLWRPTMLSLGSLAAAADIALRPPGRAVAAPLDLWMAALLGLVVAALLVRLTPSGVGHRWLATDRHEERTRQLSYLPMLPSIAACSTSAVEILGTASARARPRCSRTGLPVLSDSLATSARAAL
ncbi:MAG: hypothetical protein MZW92_46330 [Comamonadaceae bacterium]|nr:hypothetical protein [Comamonadaceae bacterium]